MTDSVAPGRSSGPAAPAAVAPVVVALRRYPVKGMVGEWLDRAVVDERGLAWDRWFAVVDGDGRFAAGKSTRRFRRRDAVLGYAAAVRPARASEPVEQGEQVVVTRDGSSWRVGDPELDRVLTAASDTTVRVLPETGVPHQDAGQVSLVGTATLEWCRRELGVDADQRRLRANLLVATAAPFVEDSWLGRELVVGTVGLRVVRLTERCRVIDVPQDGLATATPWLRALPPERVLQVGVYADVSDVGTVAVGDRLTAPG